MEELFYGTWSVNVILKNAGYKQRFQIIGSKDSDGVYDGMVGTIIEMVSPIDFDLGWKVILEWNNESGSGWLTSDIKKTLEYREGEGIIKTLGADDNFRGNRDGDYDDLVLEFNYFESSIDLPDSDQEPPNFIIPKEHFQRVK